MKFVSMRQKIILFSLIAFFINTLLAAELHFSHLGLQQSSIDVLAQDRYGFVWIGTKDGLIRYDGNVITTYRNNPDDSTTLQDNAIIALHYGKDERLWVGTASNGASYYDYSKSQFIRFETKRIGKHIYQFFDDGMGQGIFVQTGKGVFFIDKKDNVNLVLSTKYSESVLGIYTDQAGVHAILETGQKLTLGADPDNPDKTRFFPVTISQYWQLKFCQHLIREPIQEAGGSGSFYCLQEGKAIHIGLNQILKNAGVNPEKLHVYDLIEDGDGILWISSHIGLLRVAGELVTITKSLGFDGYSLSSNKLSVLLAGQKNTLFIGTQNQGLNILNLDNSGIRYFSTLNIAEQSGKDATSKLKNKPCPGGEMDHQMVWSTLKDTDGDLWIGNNTGLTYKPSDSGTFQNHSRLGNKDHFIDVCSVWSLAEADGQIWIGTQTGLITYDKQNHTFVHYQSQGKAGENDKLSGSFIRVLLHDKQRKSLWIGTDKNGLNQMDLTSGKVQYFPYASSDLATLPSGQVRSLYLDHDNRLWVGTNSGLSVWNEDKNIFRTIRAFDNPATLSDATVHTIHQPNQNYLWLGTGNGLNLFNINQFKVEKRLYERDGLTNSSIYGLIPDNRGHYWISTANGLNQFDLLKENFSNYYPEHGTKFSDLNVNTWHKDKKGLVYLGGINGLTIINPQKLAIGEKLYPPVLTHVDEFDNQGFRAYWRGILSSNSDHIMRTQWRNLRLNFTYPFFGDGDLLKSQYRLLPTAKIWSETHSGSHYVDYANLTSGYYDFQLRTNLNKAQVSSFKFYIKPYFWERIWFKTLLFSMMLASTIFLSIYFYRVWSKFSAEKLARQHYRIVEHELRPHLHEANKHLLFLSQSPRLASKDKQLIQSSIIPLITKSTDFIAELRTLLDFRRAVKEPKQLYMLEDILDEVLLFFKDDQERIIIGEVEDINVQTHQDAVYLLVKNLISNAIKYSPEGGLVFLNVYREQKTLFIECIDQGIGISKDKRKAIYTPYKRFAGEYANIHGQGIGLTIVQFIVHTYQGSIHIEDNQPKGCQFMVVLKGVVADEK